MSRRPSKSFVPRLAGLESRALQTVMGIRQAVPDVLGHAQAFAAQTLVAAPTGAVPPVISGPGQPLPIELARTRFTAAFSGPFSIGPPHYTGESALLSYRGLGTATEFLHGNIQMIVVLPRDPAGPITGAAYLQDKNTTGGNALGIDINFDKTTLDRKGRPTQGSWITDPNIYAGSNFFNQGSGVMQIRYARNGSAAQFFEGHIYTNGITNILGNAKLYGGG